MPLPNLAVRLLSAAVLVPPVLALILFAPPLYFLFACSAFAGLAGFELGGIVLPEGVRPARALLALFSSLVCFAIGSTSVLDLEASLAVVLLLAVFPLSAAGFLFSPLPLERSVSSSSLFACGVLYSGGLWSLVSLTFSSSGGGGDHWVLLLLVSAVLTDTLAYTTGRLFGVRPLAPRISPKKTRAGAVGGLLGAVLAVSLAKLTLIPELSWLHVPLFGIALGAACQIGDLVESFLKRGFGVKDSGKIIPGHGGFLDRVDSLLFAAPIVYLLSIAL